MDSPATLGGDRDGWGTEFITRWDNLPGHDVMIEEFGWTCGGWYRLLEGRRGAGTHQVIWNGKDLQGSPVPSGTYLALLVTEDGVQVHKMVLAK